MDWLFRSSFDLPTTIALWSIAGAVLTTIALFAYTIGLRLVTMSSTRRRDTFLGVWRPVFAEALLSERFATEAELPSVSGSDSVFLLEEWNRTRDMVGGDAVDNLITLAERTRIPKLARRLLGQHRLRARILAVQTLGHLRERGFRDDIGQLLDDNNAALSITAAIALTEIDPDYAVEIVVPRISRRRDWPKTRVAQILRMCGSERISEPMYRALRSAADPDEQGYLLQFAVLVEAEVLDALVEELLRTSTDPGVLNAALKLVSGYRGVPRAAALTRHDAWFVRMQAAKVLGRVGQPEHLRLLEGLLDDREWWVRYRAAQAITRLPFLGPNKLREIQSRQSDPYARDMLQQCIAEAGLA